MVNLITGFFGKHFKAIAIFGYIALFATIITFQIQKDNLREDITNISSEKKGLEIFYKAEIERITTKHNQIIKDMINDEEMARIKAENERLKELAEIERNKNKELNKKVSDLSKVKDDTNCLDTEIPKEIKEILK